ncbi:MAG TPA: anti-sigma factor [Casimicrobiaceae bacterium]|nr:anti-sigma factor [Casimicrobiaceae bacterium]
MSSARNPLSEADLHAYADGQLASDRLEEVEALLAVDPELAARVGAIRAQSAALRDALDPLLAEPVPDSLLAAATPPRRGTAVRRWIAPAFAMAASLVVGVAVGWLGRDAMIERSGTPTTFARQAAFAHALYAADVRRPVEVPGSEEKSLVTWLTKRLGFKVHAPDLNGLGYALVGGRLVAGNENPTALFMYENADKQRLSLQVRRQSVGGRKTADSGETAFRYAVENGVGVFYWVDDDCGYAISGGLDRAQLLTVAQVVYGQLAALEAVDPK